MEGKHREGTIYAYIDGANLHTSIKKLGWNLNYKRFFVWLKEKYKVDTAYLFIGFIPKYKELYSSLQKTGYVLIFKEVVYDAEGKAKGNCDADLVLRVVCDVFESDVKKIILITSDGDYASLVKFLQEKNKMEIILSPANKDRCSILLKRTNAKISYLNDQKRILSS